MKKTICILIISTIATLSVMAQITIPAADSRIQYSDCVSKIEKNGAITFTRSPMKHGRNYHLDSPGARMRFRCNAKTLTIEIAYEERNKPVRAQNSTGVFLIDGAGKPEWSFHRLNSKNRLPEILKVEIPADGKMHDYEVVMPYASRTGINSLTCNAKTSFEQIAPRPTFRCAFFGDSVTHGFTASRIDRCYPYRVGNIKGWQVINLGIGGIAFKADAASQLAGIEMDKLVIALGVNNWQGGTKPEDVRRKAESLLKNFHALKPEIPIAVITPLWVPPTWQPQKAKYDLDLYRQAITQAVKNTALKNVTLIDGSALIDHDPALFDKVAVHPNDKGFEQMAARIARQL